MSLLLFLRSLIIGTFAFLCFAWCCNGRRHVPAPERYRHWAYRLMQWADGQ